ncbi:MAG: site-2 protease family protein [Flammeovirgaceae bacterium]|nr:site-2 protease family protein [Flammeovirgaceae bacterium]
MSKKHRTIVIQIVLFITTLITTTFAGSEWTYGKSVLLGNYSWSDFVSGMQFSIPFLLILTVHEFGHYFTAMVHKVKSSLPYYIPMPPFFYSIGTLGALIRLRSKVPSTTQNFDIGIAGPLAGFVMAMVVLFYGFLTLPEPEYIFQIHPEYEQYGLDYAQHVYVPRENVLDISIGKNLLFLFFENFVGDPSRIPNPHEIMHYPILFAGFLSLVFTFLNLLPVGQLDGGHVLYGLIGFKRHRMVASVIFVAFIFYAGLGYIRPTDSIDSLVWSVPLFIAFLVITFKGLLLSWINTIMVALLVFATQFFISLQWPQVTGFEGWLLFGFILGRFIGVIHPPVEIEEPLDSNRQILGWLALLIFVLCFTPQPITVTAPPILK